MIKKAEVYIGEMEIRINVIAFPLKGFKESDIEGIKRHIEENPYKDDLTGSDGQIVIDDMQKILYTGSKLAASYIARLGHRSTSKRYSVSVFKKQIPESSTLMIEELVKRKQKRKKKIAALPEIRHNLQPVLEEINKDKK